jgi:pilus assembly protein Flp/PilA
MVSAAESSSRLSRRIVNRSRNLSLTARPQITGFLQHADRISGDTAGRIIRPAVRDAVKRGGAMKSDCSKFLLDESGATAIEYGLIAGGIALAIIAAIQSLSDTVNSVLFEIVAAAVK